MGRRRQIRLKRCLTFALCSDEVAFYVAVSVTGVSLFDLYFSAVERRAPLK